ncbi:hypothetical protein A1O3_08680 [Capronia epimyces CBS 606.96]|uniref:Uncharacterized protein n=1 Tax=Capronia epimyces CBS 606.96 TaxID=1182542 RepID=W9Y9W8_9EURO|nr:uncharacterized protein A1O3_08680 [Capronia epimyces CBS 606.96]EXJ79179.1 hypothetical protein A1O3_08680 [Capronia epimyces CBS 606.96]
MAHPSSPSPAYRAVEDRAPWSPGWIARLPWLGFAALLGSVLGLAASVGILVASNGRPIADWRIQPTVWLSVASTASNIMLHFALSEGANVSWWRRAMRPQTQLADLHRNWAFGNSLWTASTAGRHVDLIAVASILTAMAPISNPLLQRASRVTVGRLEVVSPVTLKVPVAQDIPTGYTGYISGRGYAASLFTSNYTTTVQEYYNNNVTRLPHKSSCQGNCKARVMGVGLSVNCSSYTWPFNLAPSTEQPYNVSNDPAVVNGTNVFQSLFAWQVASGNMSLNLQYKDQSPCTGDLIVRNCTLQTALVSYPVVIDGNDTISLDPSTTVFEDTISHKINLDLDYAEAGPTTLGGYYLALKNKFNSEAHLRWAGAVGYELLTTGSTATQYAVTNATTDTSAVDVASSCGLSFTDPTDDLLASARELMFRTALSIASGNSSMIQTVSGTQFTTPAVYESHYLYLGIAVILTGLAVTFVTLTFVGYQTLGRSVSMSPLEIARAFNAPLLESSNSNSDVKSLMRAVGERSVRYGAVSVDATADTGAYVVGKDGSSQARTASTASNVDGGHTRLEMADEAVVQMPRKGCTFS